VAAFLRGAGHDVTPAAEIQPRVADDAGEAAAAAREAPAGIAGTLSAAHAGATVADMSSAAQPAAVSVTWAEFVALEEDDLRELVDGVLLEIDVPNKQHEWAVSTLIWLLRAWAEPRQAGTVLGSGYKIRIDERRGVMPDVQFVRRGREAILGSEGIEAGAPDLVVEVVSPTSARYDRVQKLAWYAAIGVAEYWIIDPQGETVERLVLGTDHRFVIAESLAGEAGFRPDSFPGLEIPLADLWRAP
jgi:Uma2 family endonuclease